MLPDVVCQLESPSGIAVGKDERIYVAEANSTEVHVFTKKGRVAIYRVPRKGGFSNLSYITAGPDGNLWISDYHYIARMTVHGKTTLFKPPGISRGYMPRQIVAGPDGNVWLLQQQYENASGSWITKVTPDGKFAHYTIGGSHHPSTLCLGPNGEFWFLDQASPAAVGSISTSGATTYYTIQNAMYAVLDLITTGPKGPLWVVGRDPNTAHPYFLAHIGT
jgi:streptogramin lyase